MIFRKSVKWTAHSMSHGVRRPTGDMREYGRQNWEADPVDFFKMFIACSITVVMLQAL